MRIGSEHDSFHNFFFLSSTTVLLPVLGLGQLHQALIPECVSISRNLLVILNLNSTIYQVPLNIRLFHGMLYLSNN